MRRLLTWILIGAGVLLIAGLAVTRDPLRQAITMGRESDARPWMAFTPQIMEQRAVAHLGALVQEGHLTRAEAAQLQGLMKAEMESRTGGPDSDSYSRMEAELSRLIAQGKLTPETAARLKALMPAAPVFSP